MSLFLKVIEKEGALSQKDDYQELPIDSDLTIAFRGPSLELGAKPTLLYFALSKEDSLKRDPYNQIVEFLPDKNIRVFSITLPGHGPPQKPESALKHWAQALVEKKNLIASFIKTIQKALDTLEEKNLLLKNKIAVAGLSRGGFICSHLAAIDRRIRYLLEFAPLTVFSFAKDFAMLKDLPIVKKLNVEHLVDSLYDRKIRFYIGNCDTRVGTKECFSFFHSLVAKANDKGIRSPPIELIISPSVGYMGHGTPPKTFQSGAKWIANCLNNPNSSY